MSKIAPEPTNALFRDRTTARGVDPGDIAQGRLDPGLALFQAVAPAGKPLHLLLGECGDLRVGGGDLDLDLEHLVEVLACLAGHLGLFCWARGLQGLGVVPYHDAVHDVAVDPKDEDDPFVVEKELHCLEDLDGDLGETPVVVVDESGEALVFAEEALYLVAERLLELFRVQPFGLHPRKVRLHSRLGGPRRAPVSYPNLVPSLRSDGFHEAEPPIADRHGGRSGPLERAPLRPENLDDGGQQPGQDGVAVVVLKA